MRVVMIGLISVCALLLTAPANVAALTLYYVDPDFSGGTHTGSASQPWLDIASGWSTINRTLATDDVTVYFSARKASSDVDQAVAGQLILARTDMSTHRLTLDGMSRYNSNVTTPTWLTYSGSSRFKITSTGDSAAIDSNNYNTINDLAQSYYTIRGFKAVQTGSIYDTQVAILGNGSNVVFEYNDLTNTSTGAGGNGFLMASAPSAGGSTAHFGSNWTIQNNRIGPTPAEAVYVQGFYNLGPFLDSRHVSWANLTIQHNIITNPGTQGEGNCIDVKDGTVNTIIRGNDCRNTLTNNHISQGIEFESAALVEQNFVYGYPAGIAVQGYYNTWRPVGLEIRNNVITQKLLQDFNTGITVDEAPTGLAGPCRGGDPRSAWDQVKIYNNTIMSGDGDGIQTQHTPGCFDPTNVTVRNNIISNNAGTQLFIGAAASLATHTNNLYFNSAGGVLINNGGTTYTAETIRSFEPTALAVDPVLVNPTITAGPAGYRLQANSPAIGKAITLGSFSYDYFTATRTTPWSLGAINFRSGTSRPSPPTGLRINQLPTVPSHTPYPFAHDHRELVYAVAAQLLWLLPGTPLSLDAAVASRRQRPTSRPA